MSNSTESPLDQKVDITGPPRPARYFVSRGSFIAIVFLIGVNFVSRLTNPQVGEIWFVKHVPQDVQFYYLTGQDGPPNSQWIVGFPLRYYFEDGWQFTTKERHTLFLARIPQRPIWERLSIIAFVINVAITIALVLVVRYVAKSLVLKLSPERTNAV